MQMYAKFGDDNAAAWDKKTTPNKLYASRQSRRVKHECVGPFWRDGDTLTVAYKNKAESLLSFFSGTNRRAHPDISEIFGPNWTVPEVDRLNTTADEVLQHFRAINRHKSASLEGI